MKVDFFNDKNKNRGYVRINDQTYEMPVSVVNILILEDKIIVLLGGGLTHLTRPHANSNVICLNVNGNWLWEIEHRTRLYEETPAGSWRGFIEIEGIPGDVSRFKAWGGRFLGDCGRRYGQMAGVSFYEVGSLRTFYSPQFAYVGFD